MSANEFGRGTHWQLVKSDGKKPWHVRLVSNFRVIVYSPQYVRKIDAFRAIEIASPGWLESKTPLEVDERGHSNEHSRYLSGLEPDDEAGPTWVSESEGWVNQSDVEPE